MSPTQAKPPAVRLLLIEDNPGDARLLREVFAEGSLAMHLDVASDGRQALDMAHARDPYSGRARPDLVLLDLNLPGGDGWEVLAEIKGDPALRRIPVLILTSSRAPSDILRGDALQANGYISKPSDLSQCFQVVRSIEEFWLSVVRPPGAVPTADARRSDGADTPTVPL